MTRTTFLFLFLNLTTYAANTVADVSSQHLTEAQRVIEVKADVWLESYDVPSVAIAYIEDGAIAWKGIYGEQRPGKKADEKTLYNIASMTKSISAEVILRLASDDALLLDEPMSAYWLDPDIKNDPRHAKLTPRISLTHRTGFANWRRMTDDKLMFQFEPGEQSGYSGEGYNYVARFAEQKMRRSFEELAQAYVFDPLGMADASYIKRDWFEGRVAVPQGP